ncbi:piggyBac transposable element-derived protein 4-like [Ixodes scapularis]
MMMTLRKTIATEAESPWKSLSSSDSDLSGDEVRASARDWTKVDTTNPPATPGVSAGLDENDTLDAVGYLELLLSPDVMTQIVKETNRYADQHLATAPISRGSRVKAWKPVTEAEMKVFFALLLLQGIVDKPVVEWYWSKRRVIETPVFGEDAGEVGQARQKLRKIWPVLSLMKERFKASYMPEENISIDESLMLYKGRLSWKQFLPLKRSRFGVKFYVLCEAASGYIWDVVIYTGKGTDVDDQASAMGTKVVMRLMEPLLDQGYCLTVDNFYTSPELVEKLLSRKTDVTALCDHPAKICHLSKMLISKREILWRTSLESAWHSSGGIKSL